MSSLDAMQDVDLPGASAPFDISGVIQKARFSYRQNDAHFAGGHATYDVEVVDGQIRLRPWNPSPQLSDSHEEDLSEQSSARTSAKSLEGAPLYLETVSILRGGMARQALGSAAASVEQDGSLKIERGEVSELLQNSEAGVEQSWEFPYAPSGSGDLEIRIQVSGLEYVGETDHGLHFQDPVTGLGFRYGLPAWVDDTGKKADLAPASFAGGHLILVVPASLLETSAYPARLDPIISPEFGMDNPIWSNSGDQVHAKVASNGYEYLVVWEDSRHPFVDKDIFGARLSQDGKVLDEIHISNASGDQVSPSVAWNGSSFLVVWEDYRSSSTRSGIYGTRVLGNSVLDSSGIPIAVSNNLRTYHSKPSVSSNGNGDWLVVWEQYFRHPLNTIDTTIRSSLVNSNGVASASIPISSASTLQKQPAVAWNGTKWLVVWSDGRSQTNSAIYGKFVNAQGQALNPEISISNSSLPLASQPAVDADGNGNWLVVWTEDATNHSAGIYGARVSSLGSVIELTIQAAVSCTRLCPAENLNPTVAWNGTQWFVVWQSRTLRESLIIGRHVTASGKLPKSILIGSGTSPNVTWSGNNSSVNELFVVWNEVTNSTFSIYGGRISAAGALQDPNGLPISKRVNAQYESAVAANSDHYLVVWPDGTQSVTNIHGVRVSPTGEIQDSVAIPISTTPSAKGDVALASNGTDWLIIWHDYDFDRIVGKIVNADGEITNSTEIVISNQQGFIPVVSWGDTDWLVVWQVDRRGPIAATRVNLNGNVLDSPGISLSLPGNKTRSSYGPAVGWNGTSWLATWINSRNTVYNDIYKARVVGQGSYLQVLDPQGSSITNPLQSNKKGTVDLAWSGSINIWLAVWNERRNDGQWEIRGARLNSDGSLINDFTIAIGDVDSPSVSWTGTNWLTVWEERQEDDSSKVHGTRISAEGLILDSPSIEFSLNGRNPKIASYGPGQNLVTYWRHEPTLGNTRVIGRTFNPLENGDACTSGSECDSGYCINSMCCDNFCGGGTDLCQSCSIAGGALVDGICSPVVVCEASDQCHESTCNPSTGLCSNSVLPNGTSCDDGNACSQTDTCQSGTCIGSNPVVCTALDQCHDVGICDPSTGLCSNPIMTNGTSCDDGDACSQTDTCQNGTCTGSNPVVCTALDQCHDVGTCDPSTGVCSNPIMLEGTSCDDGDACTQTDTCQSGTCIGSNPVVCTALDQCHEAGICDPSTGVCSTPSKPDGTSCDDGDACSQTDTCQSGTCTGSNPVVCTALDQCHDVGICDPSTGVCSDPSKPNGTSCDDGDACSQTDTCQSGTCIGSNPVVCTALDQCHDVGTCDPSTGLCSNPNLPDGTTCDDDDVCTYDDACESGTCVGAPTSCGQACDSGFELDDDDTCVPCAPGSVNPAATGTACTTCVLGTAPDATASQCDPCPAGTYGNEDSFWGAECIKCPPGTASAVVGDTTGDSVCTQCPAGTFSRAGAATCTPCPQGSDSEAGAGACVEGGTSEIITGPLPLTLTAYRHVIDSDNWAFNPGIEAWLAFHISGAAFVVVMMDDDGFVYEGTWTEENGDVTLSFDDEDLVFEETFTFDPSATVVSIPFKLFNSDEPGTSTWTRAEKAEILPWLFHLFFQGATYSYARWYGPTEAINFAATHAEAFIGTNGKGGPLMRNGMSTPVIDWVERFNNGIEVHYAEPPQGVDPRQPMTVILFPTVHFAGQPLTPNSLAGHLLTYKNLPSPHNPIDDPPEKTAVFIAPFNTGFTDWFSTPASQGGIPPLIGNLVSWANTLDEIKYKTKIVRDADVDIEGLVNAFLPNQGKPTPGFIFFHTHGGKNGDLALGIHLGNDERTSAASRRAEYEKINSLYPDLITYRDGTLQAPKTLDYGVVTIARNRQASYLTVTPLFWEWLRMKQGDKANFNRSFFYAAACNSAGDPTNPQDDGHALAHSIKARAFFGHNGEPTTRLIHALIGYFLSSLKRHTRTAEEAYYNIIRVQNSGEWTYPEDLEHLNGRINRPDVFGDQNSSFVGYGLVGGTVKSFWENGWLGSTSIVPGGGLWTLLFRARNADDAMSAALSLHACWDSYWSVGRIPGGLISPGCTAMTPGRVPYQDEVAYASYLLTGSPIVPFSNATSLYSRFTLHDGDLPTP